MKLNNTHGIAAANGVKILVYGRAGRGKTTLCATAPNPVILSAEAGLLSLSPYTLPYAEIRNIQDLRDAYRWAIGASEAKQFQTICLDSLSEIAEVVLADAKAKTKDPRQAYGTLIEEMTKVIREFRDLPGFNVYFSAKEEAVKNDVTGMVMNGPSMPGARLGPMLPYFFDEVFQLSIEGTGPQSYRYLRTQPDFLNEAKDRSGRLDEREPPNLAHIITKITTPQVAA